MIGLSASLLTKDAQSIGEWARRGYDLITYKTVSSQAREGYPGPHTHWLSADTLANSVGLPSPPPDVWMCDVEAAKRLLAPHQRLIVSVADATAAVLCDTLHIDGIELNLSCPNADTAFDPASLGTLNGKPVYLKVGVLSLRAVERLLKRYPFAAGVTAVNALPVASTVFTGRSRAGLSGAVLRDDACEVVRRLKRVGVGEIISVGGVMTVEDIRQRYDLGATHVQMCTGVMRDPDLAQKWREAL